MDGGAGRKTGLRPGFGLIRVIFLVWQRWFWPSAIRLPFCTRKSSFKLMTAVEAQWSPAKHLILGDDPQLRVFAEVAVWYKKLELFRKGEDQRMFLQEPTAEDLTVHKSLLQRLIADGDHLLSLVRQVGLPENSESITTESLAATVELLHADFRGWHEPMSRERRAELMQEVFPDVT